MKVTAVQGGEGEGGYANYSQESALGKSCWPIPRYLVYQYHVIMLPFTSIHILSLLSLDFILQKYSANMKIYFEMHS